MDFLWDTNVLLHQVRQSSNFENWDKEYNFFAPTNRNFISIVTVGEIHSLAIRRRWGKKRSSELQKYLNDLVPLPIAKRIVVNAYARIDAYSQGKLIDRPLPNGLSARNMGKNDLWIAATAHTLKVTLLTTDRDFEHLNNKFCEIKFLSLK